MPSGLMCRECKAITDYKDARYVGGTFVLNHKPDCSQRDSGHPAVYLTTLGNKPLVYVGNSLV